MVAFGFSIHVVPVWDFEVLGCYYTAELGVSLLNMDLKLRVALLPFDLFSISLRFGRNSWLQVAVYVVCYCLRQAEPLQGWSTLPAWAQICYVLNFTCLTELLKIDDPSQVDVCFISGGSITFCFTMPQYLSVRLNQLWETSPEIVHDAFRGLGSAHQQPVISFTSIARMKELSALEDFFTEGGEWVLTLYGPYILESVVHDGFTFIKKGGFPYVKYGNNWHVKG